MHENYAVEPGKAVVMQSIGTFHDRTIRENIEAQIKAAIDNVERLKRVRASMEKSGLLDVKINDLQQAMRF